MGGTMRLGSWPMDLASGSLVARLYAEWGGAGTSVTERHRHRYEVNPEYVGGLTAAGLVIGGVTPGMAGRGSGLVESVELPRHPFFLGLQSHPEFKSRLMRPSPPFAGFIRAAVARAAARDAGAHPVTTAAEER